MNDVCLESALRRSPDQCAVIHGDIAVSYRQLHNDTLAISERLKEYPAGSLVEITSDQPARIISALAAIRLSGHVPVLRPLDQAHASECFEASSGIALIGEPPASANITQDSIILHTSGTSGTPKAIVHGWASLCDAVHFGPSYQRKRWLSGYHPGSFAGLQVLLQSVLAQGTLVIASRQADDISDQIRAHDVEFASGTPTYWRAFLFGTSDKTPTQSLRQVTVGGEVVDQLLLDQLGSRFPAARISQIYASTEQGVCFSVHDHMAGFPAAWLENNRGPCPMRMAESGELLLQSPRRMKGYLADEHTLNDGQTWFHTGDLVEIVGDRAMFRGRVGDTINVGGHMVTPSCVEEVIRRVPGVVETRAYGVPSSLVGQVVAAEIQVAAHAEAAKVRRDVMAVCRSSLPKHMVPAMLNTSAQPLSQRTKLTRSA